MIRSKATLAVSLAFGLALSGCGSSSSDDENQTVTSDAKILTVTGKAIDGYIVGGTVFLDINGNGKAEPNEPQKETEEGGDYTLDVPEEDAECLAYSAIIVDVPAGAWDEGSEDEGVEAHEVTDPYQIVLQPTFEPITEEDFTNGLVRNISPLTTVVWEAIERSYPPFAQSKGNNPNDSVSNAKHCHYLKNHDEAVQELQQEIEDTVNGLVQFYNLSADQMYADFIADKDSEAFHAAQDIMKGLKAAYKHKTDLKEQYADYPDAEIRVFIYKDAKKDEEYQVDNGWYRDEIVYLGTEDFIEFSKLQDTNKLDKIDFITSKFHELGQEWNDQDKNGWLSIREDTYRDRDGSYRCGNIERVSFDVEGVHYELGNIVPTESYPSIEDCQNDNFENPYERSLSIAQDVDDVFYGAEFSFREEQAVFFDLSQWINLKDKTDLDPNDLISYFDLLGHAFDQDVKVEAFNWRKSKESGGVVIHKNSDGTWNKETKQEDGTTLYECSTDGENWTYCPD